jgi:hypothetical protein
MGYRSRVADFHARERAFGWRGFAGIALILELISLLFLYRRHRSIP